MFANIRKISRLSESLSTGILLEAVILNEEGTITDTIADTSAAVAELSNEVDQKDAEMTVDAMDAIAEDPTAENVDAISEGVLSSFWNTIVTFFKKIIGFFKGIVQKIKDRVALMTRDRKKFLEEFEKQVKAKEAAKMKAPEKFSWEGAKWDVDGVSMENTYKEAFDLITKVYDDAEASLRALNVTENMDENTITDLKVDHAAQKAQLIHDIRILSTDYDPVLVTKTTSDVSIQAMKDWIANSTKVDETVKKDYEKRIIVLDNLKKDAEKMMGKEGVVAAEKTRWMAIKDTVAGHSKMLGWMVATIREANKRITAEYMGALRKYISSYTR